MGVNATVSLTLGELDGLRSELAEYKNKLKETVEACDIKVKALESTQMQVKVTTVSRELYLESEAYRDYNMGYPIIKHKAVNKIRENESVEYKNFDEVQAQLAIRAEAIVADKITSLNTEITKVREVNIQLQKNKIQEISDLRIQHSKEVDKLVQSHKDEVTKLTDEIKTLKGQELEKTKDREIEQLKQQIKELSQSKGFFSKLF